MSALSSGSDIGRLIEVLQEAPSRGAYLARLASRKRGLRLVSQQENGSKVVGVVDILGRLSTPSPGSAFERLRGGKFVEERTVIDTALSLAMGF